MRTCLRLGEKQWSSLPSVEHKVEDIPEEEDLSELFGSSESEEEFEGFSTVSEGSDGSDEDIQEVIKQEKGTSHVASHAFGKMTGSVFFMVLVCLITASWAKKVPDLGSLYNCNSAVKLGVYATPSARSCHSEMTLQKKEKFRALVKQYQKRETQVEMFLCEIHVVTKKCNENFFWGGTQRNCGFIFRGISKAMSDCNEECYQSLWRIEATG